MHVKLFKLTMLLTYVVFSYTSKTTEVLTIKLFKIKMKLDFFISEFYETALSTRMLCVTFQYFLSSLRSYIYYTYGFFVYLSTTGFYCWNVKLKEFSNPSLGQLQYQATQLFF